MDKPVAKLVRTQMEVPWPTRRGRPGYRWVPAMKVITPDGGEIQPYMRINDAKYYCCSQGWDYVIVEETP